MAKDVENLNILDFLFVRNNNDLFKRAHYTKNQNVKTIKQRRKEKNIRKNRKIPQLKENRKKQKCFLSRRKWQVKIRF